jgi:sugar phosphate isomerase/epimerase
MNINLGIMQGRLLPKYKNQFQSFPKNSWKKEFSLAKKFNLKYIEFIFGDKNVNGHPLLDFKKIQIIKNLEKMNEIKIRSICADYFMYNPLFEGSSKKKINLLKRLICNASYLNVTDIVLPFVDNSSLNSKIKLKKTIKILNSFSDFLDKMNINIALEADLKPSDFLRFIKSLKSKKFTINYDLGNSAYKNYDISEEFKSYGNKISSIHIKDRLIGGPSVVLGTGDVNFKKFFFLFKRYIRRNDIYFIMQCYRDNEGVSIFKKQLYYFKKIMQYNT